MKGLTPGERTILQFVKDNPPGACSGQPPPRDCSWSPQQERDVDELVKRGLFTVVACPCGCGQRHPAVTADGLLAYRLDTIAPRLT